MIDIVADPNDLLLFCILGLGLFGATTGLVALGVDEGGLWKYKKSIIVLGSLAVLPFLWLYVAICLQLLTGSQW